MADRFVKLKHMVDDGQEIIMRVSEDGKGDVTQFLEKFDDGQWHGVAGITSGIPIAWDVIQLVAQRKYIHERTTEVTTWGENNKRVTREYPLAEWLAAEKREHELGQYRPELTIVVMNPRSEPQQIKYERIEPPDCEDIRLFGTTTEAQGYLIVDDEESDPLLDALWEGADSNAKLKANYERLLADGKYPKDEIERVYREASALCDLDGNSLMDKAETKH